jgi:hypothetical protein
VAKLKDHGIAICGENGSGREKCVEGVLTVALPHPVSGDKLISKRLNPTSALLILRRADIFSVLH